MITNQYEEPLCKAWENHSCQMIGDKCADCVITKIAIKEHGILSLQTLNFINGESDTI